MVVAVLDTGVDIDHEFLVDNIVSGYDFVGDDSDPREEASGLDTNGNGLLDEGFGHGTHVAGIIKTIAPGVSIMPIRVIDSDGAGFLDDIIAGIHFAIDNGARVINMSLSISETSPGLEEAIARAKHADVAIVTSAGNEDSPDLSYPAVDNKVFTVVSLGPELLKSAYSNYNQKADIAAPGEFILSAHPNNRYVGRSGTSMAAPVLVGHLAILMELSPLTAPWHLLNDIEHSAYDIDDLNDPQYREKLGAGLLDIEASIQ